MDAVTTSNTTPIDGEGFAPELREFEDFAQRAIELGFTVHLTHYRFHPAHTAWAPSCQSGVELTLVPILEHTKELFGEYRRLKGESMLAVLEEGQRLIDWHAAGERLAEPIRRGNITEAERERRRQRMLDYWARKRAEEAAETIEPEASAETPGKSADA
jgi:hypothetical protein